MSLHYKITKHKCLAISAGLICPAEITGRAKKMKLSKTTKERYQEMLEVLPPFKMSLGAFLVGEPNSTRDGEYTYASFFEIDGQTYEGETITPSEFEAFIKLDDGDKLADEQEPEGDIAEELELIDTLGEEIVEAGKYLDIPLKDIEEAYAGEFCDDIEFARDMAEQCGDIKDDLKWPYTCIDWEQASKELMYDYCEHKGHYFRNL